jgi:hypothetical protein
MIFKMDNHLFISCHRLCNFNIFLSQKNNSLRLQASVILETKPAKKASSSLRQQITFLAKLYNKFLRLGGGESSLWCSEVLKAMHYNMTLNLPTVNSVPAILCLQAIMACTLSLWRHAEPTIP